MSRPSCEFIVDADLAVPCQRPAHFWVEAKGMVGRPTVNLNRCRDHLAATLARMTNGTMDVYYLGRIGMTEETE